MLINISNHPSTNWSPAQNLEARRLFGEIVDIEFPLIDPCASSKDIDYLVSVYLDIIQRNAPPFVVHLMGELSFVCLLGSKLNKAGVRVVCSTTERLAKMEGNNKISEFKFVAFRDLAF